MGSGPALKTLARRCSIPVTLELGTDVRLPEALEATAYFVVSEALTNAVKHSNAPALRVSVDALGSALRLSISDNGVGGADPTRGSGLIGLRDRVEAVGGTLAIDSRPRQGTHVTVALPVHADRPAVTPGDAGV